MAHCQVKENNQLCNNWHCKHEHVKFQTFYQNNNKNKMKPINTFKMIQTNPL